MIAAALLRLKAWSAAAVLAAVALAGVFLAGRRSGAAARQREHAAEVKELQVEVRAQQAAAEAHKEVARAAGARAAVEEEGRALGGGNVRARAKSRWTGE